MVPEREGVVHVYDVHAVVLVLLPEGFQYPNLLLGLSVEALLVSDHLEGNVPVLLVVVGLDDLAEAALTYDLEDLVPVGHVVVGYVDVRALVVVVLVVVGHPYDTRPLLGVNTYEVDLGVVEDLVVLVGRELVHVELHDYVRGYGHRLGLQGGGNGDHGGLHRGGVVLLFLLVLLLLGRARGLGVVVAAREVLEAVVGTGAQTGQPAAQLGTGLAGRRRRRLALLLLQQDHATGLQGRQVVAPLAVRVSMQLLQRGYACRERGRP